MKKAGIVTFHDADNFGAVLQSWALMRALGKIGVEGSFISFSALTAAASEGAPESHAAASPLLKRILAQRDCRARRFADFREQRLRTVEFHEGIADEFDLFIAGSDQVWNPMITGGADKFFLSFAPQDKRFSYAASFGVTGLPESETQRYAQGLQGFARLSVRERSGAEIAEKLTGRQIAVCLDPTLLLNATDYKELVQDLPKGEESGEEDYVLLISVQNDPVLFATAKAFAAERSCQLRIITASYFPAVGFEPWSGVSVPDWLRLVKNARTVLTSSFHGLVFSILFERDFRICPLKAELKDRNVRMEELAWSLGIDGCLLGGDGIVDWQTVQANLGSLRESSWNYLREIGEICS